MNFFATSRYIEDRFSIFLPNNRFFDCTLHMLGVINNVLYIHTYMYMSLEEVKSAFVAMSLTK